MLLLLSSHCSRAPSTFSLRANTCKRESIQIGLHWVATCLNRFHQVRASGGDKNLHIRKRLNFLVTATRSSGVDLQKTREKSELDNPKVLADSSMSLTMSCFLLTLLSEPSNTGSRLLGGEIALFPFTPSLLIEVGGCLGGTTAERSSHLFFLVRDFLGVG